MERLENLERVEIWLRLLVRKGVGSFLAHEDDVILKWCSADGVCGGNIFSKSLFFPQVS